MTQSLSVYRVEVARNKRDQEVVFIGARDQNHARALAIATVRTRHSLPTSVALFATVR